MTSTSAQPGDGTPRRKKRLRWAVAAATAVVVLLAVGAALSPAGSSHDPGSRAVTAIPSNSPSASPIAEKDMTGNQLLLALADRISDSDADTSTGTYAMLHIKVWGKGTAVEYRTWRTPDGLLTYGLTRKQPSVSGASFELAKASLDFSKTAAEAEDPRCASRYPDLTLSGQGDPVKELDWALMLMRGGSKPATPSILVDQVVGLNRDQLVPTDMRKTILRWLAKIPGWTHQTGTDLSLRSGLVFSVADGDNNLTLILDGKTGQLLASDFRYGTGSGSLAYTLFTARTRTMTNQPDITEPTPMSTQRPGGSHLDVCTPQT